MITFVVHTVDGRVDAGEEVPGAVGGTPPAAAPGAAAVFFFVFLPFYT